MGFHHFPNVFVSQVKLKVSHLERSLHFYKEIIGFHVLEQSEREAILTADGRTALLKIVEPINAVEKQPRTTGLYHFALLLPSRKDLGQVLRHFLENDYPLQGASDHLVSEALYLADPDGNGIEIYCDRPSNTWEWSDGKVRMETNPLDAKSVLAEGKGEGWGGLPTGTLMGHIHLHVSDLQSAEAFYSDGLGFNMVARYGSQAAFLSTGGYHHHIGLNTWNGVGAPVPLENSVGLKNFTLTYTKKEQLEESIERLKNLGAKVDKKDGLYITQDPSGNEIQFLV